MRENTDTVARLRKSTMKVQLGMPTTGTAVIVATALVKATPVRPAKSDAN